MTDCFALLDQPRRAWLDPEQLKQAFHAKTLRAHPDAQPMQQNEGAFSEINEAYQVLRDPKRRLQHLLALQGDAPSKESAAVPKEIEKLFPTIAAVTRDADLLIAKLATAANALSRSLLRAETMQVLQRLNEARATMAGLQENALVRLKQVETDDAGELTALYLLFSYAGRWTVELEERDLRLALPAV